MCEIVVLDPEQTPIQAAQEISVRFHDEQGDGLGVVAVHNEGDAFDYNIFKSTAPHWQTLYTFFKRNYGAWRIVIHGRAMTSGKRNWDTCHPIEVECGKCEFDYVVHNGSVRKHTQKRGGLTTAGHDFNTEVDTEVIAHTVEELPDSVSDHGYNTYPLKGNLNYLLFSEDGILVRSGSKYDLSDSFTMTCSYRDFDEPEELGFTRGRNKRWALVTPSNESPEIEIEESYRRNSTSSRNTTTSNVTSAQDLNSEAEPGDWQDYSGQDSRANPNKYTETVDVTYDDHADFENISAIKVAPGVMRVIDHDENEDEYVFRDDDPRLYFWYAPDPTPDNIGDLEQEAQGRGRSSEQESLEMLFEGEEAHGPEGEAVYEEVATTVAGEIDEVTVADLADIKDDVIEAAFGGAKAAQKAHGD